MSVIKSFEHCEIVEPEVKFPTPDIWAEKAVKSMGAELAATVARREMRPMIGTKNDEPNPNAAWYRHAYNWIVKRYPKVK